MPLVVTTTAGRPDASPRPRATKPADRSSSTTWTRTRRVGVQGHHDRRRAGPGRHHGVGDSRPGPLVDQGGAEGGLDVRRRARSCQDRCRAASPSGWGEGDAVVLVHGFTQSARSWEADRPALAAGAHRDRSRRPRPRPTPHGVAADLPAGADLMAPAAGGRRRLRRLLDGRPAMPCTWRCATPSLVAPAGPGQRHRRHRRPRGPGRPPGRRRGAGRPGRGGRRGRLRRLVAGPAAVRHPAARGRRRARAGCAGTAAGLAVQPAPGRHRHQEPLWAAAAPSSPCRCWSSPASSTRPTWPTAAAWRPASGPTPPWPSVPGAGHACHLERPDAFLEIVGRSWTGR